MGNLTMFPMHPQESIRHSDCIKARLFVGLLPNDITAGIIMPKVETPKRSIKFEQLQTRLKLEIINII